MPSEIPNLTYIKTANNQRIVDLCPTLKKFKPVFWAQSGEAQTYLQYMLPNKKTRYAREWVAFSDGVETSLDWKYAKNILSAPIILCLHGLGGDSSSNYMEIFTNYCQAAGYTTVVYNRRGHADSSLLPKVGNVADASCVFPRHVNMSDMVEVVTHICAKWPLSKKYLVGFSCGGNLAINYQAHVGDASPFAAAAAICNGYNILTGTLELSRENKRFNKIATDFLKDLLYSKNNKQVRLAEAMQIAKEKNIEIDWKAAKEAKSLPEFESCFAPSYGVTLEQLYLDDSSHDKLLHVKKPMLCIQNNTDPFIPVSMNRYPAIGALQNPNIFYVETKAGGHLGWIDSFFGTPWYIRVILEYFRVKHA